MQTTDKYFVSVMTADRPGILAHIGQRLLALGGDIEEASQTVMGGFFTVLLFVRFREPVDPERLEAALHEGMPDLAIGVQPEAPAYAVPVGPTYILTARGRNKPGLIASLCSFLSGRDINIEDMYIRRDQPDSDEFVMILQIRCPEGSDLRRLQLDLSELADDLGMALHLQHENVFLAVNDLTAVRTLMV